VLLEDLFQLWKKRESLQVTLFRALDLGVDVRNECFGERRDIGPELSDAILRQKFF